MKLKPILPSLKEKKRYLSFEIISEHSFSADDVSKAAMDSILSLLGTLEAGKAGLMFLSDKYSNNSGIIKTNHKFVDKVRTALALVSKIDGEDMLIRTRIVSGTLKKAISKYITMKKQEAEA